MDTIDLRGKKPDQELEMALSLLSKAEDNPNKDHDRAEIDGILKIAQFELKSCERSLAEFKEQFKAELEEEKDDPKGMHSMYVKKLEKAIRDTQGVIKLTTILGMMV